MSTHADQSPMILCWDGSEGAQVAMRHAAELLGPGRRGIVLFVYVPTEAARGVLAGRSGPDAAPMNGADAQGLLDQGVSEARAAGIDAEGLLIAADRKTSEIIAAVADEREAQVIVMGQRRRSPLGTLVLGSVARDVLSAQHRPVLMVDPSQPRA